METSWNPTRFLSRSRVTKPIQTASFVGFITRSDGSSNFKPMATMPFFLELHLSELLQGYSGMVHGGVIATLLDAAMTHCLFAGGIEAVTGDLNIRYRYPVPVNSTVSVHARIDASCPPLYKMKSEIVSDETVLVRAKARFVAL